MQRPLFLHCRLHMAREPLAAQALARDTPASPAATLLNRQKHVPHMLTYARRAGKRTVGGGRSLAGTPVCKSDP